MTRKMKKTGGNADLCENKRVEEKATQKSMKKKGMQIDVLLDGFAREREYPTPGILRKEAASY
jgi:hypothetical protein